MDVVDDVLCHLLIVDDLCVKFGLIAGNGTVEIHVILG